MRRLYSTIGMILSIVIIALYLKIHLYRNQKYEQPIITREILKKIIREEKPKVEREVTLREKTKEEGAREEPKETIEGGKLDAKRETTLRDRIIEDEASAWALFNTKREKLKECSGENNWIESGLNRREKIYSAYEELNRLQKVYLLLTKTLDEQSTDKDYLEVISELKKQYSLFCRKEITNCVYTDITYTLDNIERYITAQEKQEDCIMMKRGRPRREETYYSGLRIGYTLLLKGAKRATICYLENYNLYKIIADSELPIKVEPVVIRKYDINYISTIKEKYDLFLEQISNNILNTPASVKLWKYAVKELDTKIESKKELYDKIIALYDAAGCIKEFPVPKNIKLLGKHRIINEECVLSPITEVYFLHMNIAIEQKIYYLTGEKVKVKLLNEKEKIRNKGYSLVVTRFRKLYKDGKKYSFKEDYQKIAPKGKTIGAGKKALENSNYILLVTDIHIWGPDNAIKVSKLIKGLIGEAKHNRKTIIITGDILEGRGYGIFGLRADFLRHVAQYNEFLLMVDQLPSDIEYIIIPGNHDVAFNRSRTHFSNSISEILGVRPNIHILPSPAYFSVELDGVHIRFYTFHGQQITMRDSWAYWALFSSGIYSFNIENFLPAEGNDSIAKYRYTSLHTRYITDKEELRNFIAAGDIHQSHEIIYGGLEVQVLADLQKKEVTRFRIRENSKFIILASNFNSKEEEDKEYNRIKYMYEVYF